MKTTSHISAPLGALIAFSLGSLLFAQEAPSGGAVEPAQPAQANAEAAPAPEKPTKPAPKPERRPSGRRGGGGTETITFASDIHVKPGQTAREAVAIMGNITIDGETREAVAIIGSVTANTPVENAVSIVGSSTINAGTREAVAIVGNVYVNSHVRGNVVAVGGGVELGPDARVDGEVVALGGPLKRDKSATIGGRVVQLKLFNNLDGFNAWITTALGKARLLALAPGLGWAWMVAGAFLICHLLATLLFPKAVVASAAILEQRPGHTFLAAILAAILWPLLSLLLMATGVGAIVVFFAGIAFALLGKAAFLAWLGRRATHPLGIAHPAPAVLIGGVALALLYCVPVLGIMIWKFSGFLGTGMIVHAAIVTLRRRREERAAEIAARKAAHETANPPAPGVPPAMPETAIVTTQTAAALAPRAGFWIRAGALLIDLLMVAVVAKTCHAGIVLLPLFAIYCIVMWALRGTTIGGIICGLKIVRPDGRPVDWGTAIVRALSGFLSILPAGLGFIWVALDDERQSWHDKIAGTVVVHAPKGQSLI